MPNHRILIVDDEKQVLQATARALRLAGNTVHPASNAVEALKACEGHSFDVVVLDFMMPGVDGLELLARIRKIQPHVRSIIISGKLDAGASETEITSQLRESVEADVFLHKPLSGPKLVGAIEELMASDIPSDWREIASNLAKASGIKIGRARKAAKTLKKLSKKGKTP